MTRSDRSRGRCSPSAPMSLFMTSGAGSRASAPRRARSGRWRSRASRPAAALAARSSTAARRRPFGFACTGREACRRAGGVEPGAYGRILRIDLATHDRRLFTPTPWGSPSWWRGYGRRSAMERINSRIDRGFGFETHYTRGLAKMKTRIGLALAVMMALALGQVRAGHAERMRTLVGAVPLRDTRLTLLSAFRHRRSTGPAAGKRQAVAALVIMFIYYSEPAPEPAGSARPPGPDRRYPVAPPQRCARGNRHSAHASIRGLLPARCAMVCLKRRTA